MEIKFINCSLNDKQINLEFDSTDITAISTNNSCLFCDLISLKLPLKGEIIVDGIKVNDSNISEYQRKISIVNTYKPISILKTVLEYMNFIITTENLKMKNPNKKIIDSLKIVGLNEKYLFRELNTLSKSEKELIQIATALLSNPEMLVLTEQFSSLDLKNQKKIYMLLLRLKEQYHKTIIILSTDTNILYKYCTRAVIIKNDKVITGPIKDVYSKVETLRRSKIRVPDIVEFTYQARKQKKAKIDYHKDIRDIIKDIYKHI